MRPYFEPGRGKTTWLHLMEVYYALLRDGGARQAARAVVSSFEPLLLEFISYVDAIGYSLAQRRKLRFLTGDRAFKGLPGVAFVRIPSG